MFWTEPSSDINQLLWNWIITIFLCLFTCKVQSCWIIKGWGWWLHVLILSSKITFKMHKERDLFLEFLRIIFELILVINIVLVYFLDVKKILFSQWQYFCTVIEKYSIRIIIQNVADTIFRTVIDPLFDGYVIIINFLRFAFC